jgi:hypothetical protein
MFSLIPKPQFHPLQPLLKQLLMLRRRRRYLLNLVGEGGDEGRVGRPAVQDGPAHAGQARGSHATPELVEGGAGGGARPLRELRESHCRPASESV